MFRTGMRVGDTVQVGDTVKQIIEIMPGGYILKDLTAAEAAAVKEQQAEAAAKRKTKG